MSQGNTSNYKKNINLSYRRGKPFIRKGGSRDWKNYFTKEQSDCMDKEWREKVCGTIAENWWKEEMAWDVNVETTKTVQEDFYSSGPLSPTDDFLFTSSDLGSFGKPSESILIGSCRQHLSSTSSESGYGSFDENFIEGLLKR